MKVKISSHVPLGLWKTRGEKMVLTGDPNCRVSACVVQGRTAVPGTKKMFSLMGRSRGGGEGSADAGGTDPCVKIHKNS